MLAMNTYLHMSTSELRNREPVALCSRGAGCYICRDKWLDRLTLFPNLPPSVLAIAEVTLRMDHNRTLSHLSCTSCCIIHESSCIKFVGIESQNDDYLR
jgi:hypothetical protein